MRRLPYRIARKGRNPTRKEKMITAKSLRDYFSLARNKSRKGERKMSGYEIGDVWLGSYKTRSRMSKGMAQSIYYNRLFKVMNMMDEKKK